MDFPTVMPTCHRVPQVYCISILEWKSFLCDLQSKTEILVMSSQRILIDNISPYIFHHFVFVFLFLLRSMSRYHSINHLRSSCENVLTFLLRPFSHVGQHLFCVLQIKLKLTSKIKTCITNTVYHIRKLDLQNSTNNKHQSIFCKDFLIFRLTF